MLKISLLLKKLTNFTGKLREKSRCKYAKFSGYWFYMNTTLEGDFQICVCVPLNYKIILIKSIIICILMNHLKVFYCSWIQISDYITATIQKLQKMDKNIEL